MKKKRLRQRNRRWADRRKKRIQSENSKDKSFAAALLRNLKKTDNKTDTHTYPHMEWSNEKGMFVPKRPEPSPRVSVKVSLMHSAYKTIGVELKGSRKRTFSQATVDAIADTGCQTPTAGIELLKSLNCSDSYLIPTKHRIVGITHSSLGIIGSLLLRIELNGVVTRQMVHISTNVKGLYLSQTALKDLNLINKSFPNNSNSSMKNHISPNDIKIVGYVGEHSNGNCCSCSTKEIPVNDDDDTPCECLPRAAAPSRPECIPFKPIPENIPKLKTWLEKSFASSAFNMCTHQPLPKMTGASVEVVFKDGATLKAVHVPIPVAHHWKKKVKKALDCDVRLGTIEPVPQGTVTRWCSRMVVTPKKIMSLDAQLTFNR